MVRIQMGGVPEYFNLPILLALENNEFSKVGIDLIWHDIPEGTGKMVQSLADGSLDIVVALTEGATQSIANGNPSKIIHTYVQSPLRWGIHTENGSDAESIRDLEGQTFAISRYGSGSHLMALLMAKELGWDPSQLRFKVVQNLEGAREALRNDTAQIFLWEKYTTKFLVELGEFRKVGEYPTPWPCFVIAASDRILQENGESVKTLLEVILKSIQSFSASDQAASLIIDRYEINRQDVQDFLPLINWNKEITLPKKETKNVLKIFHELGQLDSANQVVTHAFDS